VVFGTILMGFTAHLIPWFGTSSYTRAAEFWASQLTTLPLGIATAFVTEAGDSVAVGTVALQQAMAMFVLGKGSF
jgi:hypothetical protein